MNKLLEYGLYLFNWVNTFVIFYICFVCLFYLVLFLISTGKLKREEGLHKVEAFTQIHGSDFAPPISILVPAYNEEVGIVGSVKSLMTHQQYPNYEIIVINDGSKDSTVEKMIHEFNMIEIKKKVIRRRNQIQTQPIQGIYKSQVYSNLLLIDKLNGGKSDALNAGINLSKYPYFVSLDGDTVLEKDAFLKVMKPIIEDKDHEIIAAGGSVAIANGCKIKGGELEKMELSRKPLVVMQVIEYLRAFLMGRIGLSQGNLLLIVSGAFGVFRTDRVVEAGGYKVGTVGEDMELVVRLHRLIKEKKWNARIFYVPDPVCYTEAPEDLTILKRQRTRWHRGLFESLWNHRTMILNPRYGGIGMIAMPYFLFVELLGPAIELIGYLFIVLGFSLGKIYWQSACILFLLMFAYGSFLSMGAVLLEEWSLRRYNKPLELTRLFFYALAESFWYRPLMTIWRFQGLVEAIRGKKHSWGEMTRKGVSEE
ncbi:glycosyltransferase [Ammoniphilus sp. CFH 90114]|uniref:glycosyltransferase family 2 protein n=1 Tax=Ammoniphilus sp. CFH 90114 TaxID=2493665 RepID=UPI00100ED181|nr:glycosyltransferase [Ammoniphilus sp. CFH 90114]RXT06274.1 glycosyltransferase family 2 protein [Ammoniphilus sp. CFH 90114]